MKLKRTGRLATRTLLEHLEPRLLLTALPVVSLTAPKSAATELNGMTTGAGLFKFTRTGSTAAPLIVAYTIDAASTALNGTDYDTASALTGTAIIAAGSASATLLINPLDTGLADGPKKVILDLVVTGTAPTYRLGSRKATVTITDHAPTITLTATKTNASEINGMTTGAGVFTFRRSGSTAGTLSVPFTVTGTATEGNDFLSLPSHSVNFTAGQTTATVTINPLDDILTEGRETVILTLAADATPAAFHFKATPATIGIADDTRAIFFGTIAPLTGAIKNTAFAITYADLLTATGVRDHAGQPISFKVTAIKSGTLQRDSAPAVAGKAIVAAADSLAWTPAANATGSIAAFSIIATDGTHSTGAITLTISVTTAAATIPHPASIEVLPAALDQPQINAIAYVGSNTTPQVGQTTTLDPNTLDNMTVNTFNVTGYLDTGASSILISNPTNSVENLPLLQSGGNPVIYSDVGVAGSDNFQVSDNIRLSLASFYQRTDLDQFSNPAQTIPITTPYTPIPAPNNSLRVEVGPFVPTVDNPVTDQFSSLINDLSALDVIGMPAMQGRVTVIDPTRVNSFGTVLDQLLADPNNPDLSALNADMSVHSFIYAPGTPFHPDTTATDPGIPATQLHVKLSYADFSRFTQVTPAGNPGPTLVHNPFIGQDPVSLLEGTSQPSVPGIKITRTIDVPAAGGGTVPQTLSSEGNWLLDTGAAASIISQAQAAKLDVSYQAGTFGTDAPVLVDQNGTPLPNQFTLGIGGIGGQETLAGFYLDSMLVRTQEGSASNDANPNNIVYTHEPVLVGDITVKDPNNGQTLTLDGVFGMNNLIASADFSLDSSGNLSNFNAATGYYNWITFDEPNGILGLNYDPAALAASPAAAPALAALPQMHTAAAVRAGATSATTASTSIVSSLGSVLSSSDVLPTAPTGADLVSLSTGNPLTATVLKSSTISALDTASLNAQIASLLATDPLTAATTTPMTQLNSLLSLTTL